MYHASVILSTCGTAVLTNAADGFVKDGRTLVNKYSNKGKVDAIPQEDVTLLRSLIDEVRNKLKTASFEEVSSMSAELNALILFYDGQLQRTHDSHILLCTDTWLGEELANLEADWLRRYCPNVQVIRQKDLQTADLDAFQSALCDLVKFSEETFPSYRESGYRIIFNLTAGFKSVQGFLQTLAMFYADEVIYVFQEADTLMRIPRLPIKLNPEIYIEENLQAFRQLGLGLPVEDAGDIPETLLMRVGQNTALSPWGELIWKRTSDELYERQLWPSPSAKLNYEPNFAVSLKGIPPNRLRMVNRKVDDLAKYLETTQDRRSLDFKKLKGGPIGRSTHELDAWSDADARRIYGHYEGQVFILDRLDQAQH